MTDFAALRSAISSAAHRLVFFAFDLLHLNGHDLRDMTLEDRRHPLGPVNCCLWRFVLLRLAAALAYPQNFK